MSSPFNSPASRREFLRRAGALSAVGATGAPFALNLAALSAAAAENATDYKALVCLFLYGGNDAYNMVLPTDADSWSRYVAARNQQPDPLALRAVGTPPEPGAPLGTLARLGGVLPIKPRNDEGRTFAVHPLMGALRDLFASGRLAVLPNIGTLVQPLTKAQYASAAAKKPPKLFSHNDQTSTWQTLQPEGGSVGWGGRMGDLLASANSHGAVTSSVFTSISAAGNAGFLAGREVLQYQLSPSGAIRIGGNTLFGSSAAPDILRDIVRHARTDSLFEQDHAAVVGRSIDAQLLIAAALPSARATPFGTPGAGADPLLQYDNPLRGAKETNDLAQQLQIVARTIAARDPLGAKRQVFFVSLGGFDNHDFQMRNHTEMLARLAHGLRYFDAMLTQMGVASQVTTFTASDYGRTFTSNGDGTDHGWGSHHLVMGGAVAGGDFYGAFPEFGSPVKGDFSSPDQIHNGAMLPRTSVEQLGATLGKWFGLSGTQLLDVFPNLANFDAGTHDLGFMKA
ncbi:MAG: hypothetical protein JWP52_4137 [Rhizobacter sp.]|nr:hypothetical protein [Rhizobacter sp.]